MHEKPSTTIPILSKINTLPVKSHMGGGGGGFYLTTGYNGTKKRRSSLSIYIILYTLYIEHLCSEGNFPTR